MLVEHLARASHPLSLQQLQHGLAIPRSSLHALVATTVRAGWAVQRDGGYALGPVARLLGSTQLDDINIDEVAANALTRLRNEVQETVHLATLDGRETLYLVSRFSPHALGIRFQPGRRLPAQITALGKAMLAACSPDQLAAHLPDEYIAPTPNSVRSEEQLRKELEQVRQRGYAIDDEETAVGLRCFAVALPTPMPPIHAISCSAPLARLDSDREALIVSALVKCRDELLGQLTATV